MEQEKKLVEIKKEAELKSRLSYQQTYKKGVWMDESPRGKQFIVQCIKETNSPVEMKRQGRLENGVEYIDVRIYFKIE